METRRYTLPVVGIVLDWESMSGDPSDPVRVVGPHELAAAVSWPPAVPAAQRGVALTLVSLDVDEGTALVQVEAHPAVHAALSVALAGKTPAQVAQAYGYRHLKRPKDAPQPLVSLRFEEI